MRLTIPFFFCLFMATAALANDISKEVNWTGQVVHFALGSIFDFELEKRKGDDLPTQAMFKYGYAYGYQWNSGFYAAAALDWTIVYPRMFSFKGRKMNFFAPPISLWYTPLTDLQIGYAWNSHWLTTMGLIYYWGISLGARYRPEEHFFVEFQALVWMDRIFNTGGYYGGGLDNLHLTSGVGFLF